MKMNTNTILVCDDDKEIVDAIEIYLSQEGYQILKAYDGLQAVSMMEKQEIQLLIIDIMMPKLDGLEVLRQLRKEGLRTPVLLLTAKGEVEDRIEGLDMGADDYLPKPFVMGELLARIRAMLRRREEFTPEILTCGDVSLNLRSYELSGNGQSFVLPKLEYRLMELLMLNQGMYLSSGDLLVRVWGYDTDAEIGIVWVYISYLRKRLAALGSYVTVRARRNIGYMLDAGNGQ